MLITNKLSCLLHVVTQNNQNCG